MAKLYLVGTNHFDMNGPKRLEILLDRLNPEVIGLESSRLHFEQRMATHIKHQAKLASLKPILTRRYGSRTAKDMIIFMNLPYYEVFVSSEFIDRSPGARIVCCDELEQTDEMRAHQREMNTLVETKQIKSETYELPGSIEELAKFNFRKHQERMMAFDSNPSFSEFKDHPSFAYMTQRDGLVALKIREELERTNHAFVYIGGIGHMFGDYHNLYERLKDLFPTRIKLSQIDKSLTIKS